MMKKENLEKLGIAIALLGLVMMMVAFAFPSREIMAIVGSIGFICGIIGIFLGVSARR